VISAEKAFTWILIRNREVRLRLLLGTIEAAKQVSVNPKQLQVRRARHAIAQRRVQSQALQAARDAFALLQRCKKALAEDREYEAIVQWEAMEEKEARARMLSYEAPGNLSRRQKREPADEQRRTASSGGGKAKARKSGPELAERDRKIYEEAEPLLLEGWSRSEVARKFAPKKGLSSERFEKILSAEARRRAAKRDELVK